MTQVDTMKRPDTAVSSAAAAVQVSGVRKRYPERDALAGVSLRIERGEVFGVLGPNGAGKTTLLECVVGLREPSAGTIRVLGLDPRKQREQLQPRIGVQPQEANLFPQLTVVETLELWSSFYAAGRDPREVLDDIGLVDSAGTRVKRLSGGQRQRLLLGISSIGRPEIMFLDEPTAGLDPHARQHIWALVRRHREAGGTVVITTHVMEEAHALCDRLAIIDRGRIVACDRPDVLVRDHADVHDIRFTTSRLPASVDLAQLDGVSSATVTEREDGLEVRLSCDEPERVLRDVLDHPEIRDVQDLRIERGSLEDVFLSLTGRPIDTEEASA